MAQKLRTILYSRHKLLGAAMTDFAGWEMPLYYSGITEEHCHTRSKVGLFDLSHMGRFIIRGSAFREFLDWVTPAPIALAQAGKVLYSFFLNERGGVIDDITIYMGTDCAMLVVNAANRQKDYLWLMQRAAEFTGVEIEDHSEHLAMIAVQGPLADRAMEYLFGSAFCSCAYYSFQELAVSQLPVPLGPMESSTNESLVLIYSATGYTGELGYEIYAHAAVIEALWDKLIANATDLELKPIGLGARDSLRLEAAMPLYGHELTDEILPLEAGLSRFVDFSKPTSFIGREALETQREQGVSRKLVGLEMSGRGAIPRHGCAVKNSANEIIGTVTSGGYSPTLEKNIALAYVATSHTAPGTSLQVEIRGRLWPATVVKKPFYKRSR
ncbi:MAG: glycine cleavage system aminomethyltransferase GcvT [Candidatus Sumerlaeaceae bacterium]|jgi:aminomethyltransferase